jgi:AAA domain/Bifunctional DNA primase/polymerase, N-terminal
VVEVSDDEFKELPERETTWQRMERATQCRKRLLAAGYWPLPVNGKAPPIAGWQQIHATDKIVGTWEQYVDATNSGVLTRETPAADIDITIPDAADAVETLAREHFEERGYILVRFGKAPKRVILLRTDEPFKKLLRAFTALDGSEQQIEILGSGQQVVVAGVHPDTGKPYSWHGGEPGEIKREELPYVREADMLAFLDAVTELLIRDFGFKTKKDDTRRKSNGASGEQARTDSGTAGTRERAYAEAALEGCAAELAAAASGGRNETLNKIAFRLGRMVARGWIKRAEVEAALTEAMTANGYVAEEGIIAVEKTLRSGLDAGEIEPHPDLTDQPGNTTGDEWTEANSGSKQQPKVFRAKGLNGMRFDPIKFVVPDYIVEGLTLFAGKPKIGKSWMLLHVAFAVAEGGLTLGNIHCQEGDVLYAALEDNMRRVQSRLTKLFGTTPEWPDRLHLICEMPRLTEGGLDFIKSWIEGAERPRLIIIDTLAMVRMPNRKDQNSYDADYQAVQQLRTLALKYGVAIVLVHHLRKAEADDVFDTISGTLGLTGAPDTIMVIKRDAIGTTLHARGRDLLEIEKAIQFDAGTCTWSISGNVGEVRKSAERAAIVTALEEAGTEPLTPNQIASHCGMKPGNVRFLLARMLADGVIKKMSYGKYVLAAVAAAAAQAAE